MWPNPQFPAALVTFTEKVLNEKLYFLCSVLKAGKVKNSFETYKSCQGLQGLPIRKDSS